VVAAEPLAPRERIRDNQFAVLAADSVLLAPPGPRTALPYGRLVAVKLHRCSTPWKAGPCWRVQKALDEQGIDYEVVKGPMRPGRRVDLQRISGQRLYPVIQLEDGSTYREDSADMAATIRAGTLGTKRRASA
jgi:glutaredoxin